MVGIVVNLIRFSRFLFQEIISSQENYSIIGEPNGLYPVTVEGSTRIDIVTEDPRDICGY